MFATAGLRAPSGLVFKQSGIRPAARPIARRVRPVQASLQGLAVQAALSFANIPPEALLAGGAVVLAAIGGIALAAANSPDGGTIWQAGRRGSGGVVPEPLPRENAALVFGATGRMGRTVVQSLLAQGRTVVAVARSSKRATEVFGKAGIVEGRQPSGGGILFVESGVDITNADTLTPQLFAGVSQVVTAVGAVFGRTAEGAMGYLDDMTPERVDAGGLSNVAAAAAAYLSPAQRSSEGVLRMRSAEDLQKWQRLDDVIMGGQSSSGLVPAEDGSGAVWSGELIVEGGGFCGTRTQAEPLDLSAYDGIALRVKSDGQTFKLNIKTDAQSEVPEDTYQATFDTCASGGWVDVTIPWHEFVLVKRARSVPGAPPIDPARIRQFGLVLSRFEFNGFPNPRYRPGKFELAIEGGIRAFKDPRPQLLMVSSAGVERNAKVGDDEEARKRDIPIVQLNPGAILNHKYTGENAVRASGLTYCVLRPTGLTNESEPGDFLLEASQGDRISGRISREELASVVVAALGLPAATGKTMELRRQESADAAGKVMSDGDRLRLFLGVVEDRVRTRAGLEPFPMPAPPPAPVTEERKKEILSDVRVVKSVAAGRGGRVRDEKESAEASSVTVTSDGREKAAQADPAPAAETPAPAPARTAAETPAPAPAPAADTPAPAPAPAAVAAPPAPKPEAAAPASPPPAAAASSAPAGDGEAPNVAEARAWIAAWRAAADSNGDGGDAAAAPAGSAEAPANVAEAREWIRSWRAAQLEAKLPASAQR